MVYFLGVTSIYYMFFPFFLWEEIFFLVEGFESQTKVWMPDSLVWTLKAVTDTASALGYALERPCGLLGPFSQWLLAFVMGLPKRQWINTTDEDQTCFLDCCWWVLAFTLQGEIAETNSCSHYGNSYQMEQLPALLRKMQKHIHHSNIHLQNICTLFQTHAVIMQW